MVCGSVSVLHAQHASGPSRDRRTALLSSGQGDQSTIYQHCPASCVVFSRTGPYVGHIRTPRPSPKCVSARLTFVPPVAVINIPRCPLPRSDDDDDDVE